MLFDQKTYDDLIVFRHELHQFPEVSGDEKETSSRVATFLEQFEPDQLVRNLGGHGLAAVYKGLAEGPTVLIRCELDGLPIEETGTAPYKSTISGKGHLCGHDGHMTMVAGIASLLHRTRPTKGRVILMFQPAEETGAGAKAVIEDPAFSNLKPDYAFSLHNLPGRPLHEVGLKSGPFNCASQGLWVTLEGKTSHASHPEDGRSPANAMCELVTKLADIPKSPELTDNFSLVTVVHARLGEEAFGITPGAAKVMVTLRSETDEVMAQLQAISEGFIKEIGDRHTLETNFGYEDIFAASVNDDEATDLLRAALSGEKVGMGEMPGPMRWSEDFGQFSRVSKSAMFTLGSGVHQPQLHNPDFDFPDELIETGTKIFHRVIRNILGPSN
ncbi:amidohydrolase [Kiloniella sp.]|uniref:amidohydrolase n=1 Tax=Kiloniella sp. TaxID=1938587 RepID=UPI003B0170EA